jgi:hypothetical protein
MVVGDPRSPISAENGFFIGKVLLRKKASDLRRRKKNKIQNILFYIWNS